MRNTVRMWTATTWFFVLGGISLAIGGSVFGYELANDKGFAKSVQAGAPVAAATIALLSLIATSVSLTANWRRQRRLDTLNAWNAWSDSTVADRRLITDRLGMLAFPNAVAVALAEDKDYKDSTIDLTDKAVRRETRTALVRILNGLERMAVGVEAAVYDQGTLRLVGGTIIIREYERGEEYVRARREASVPELRQVAAYVWLESMVANLKSANLKKDGVALDERRLEIMKGHRKR